ncbi:hypothetical protein BC937DRAFT_89409 [Endogone sp. FLAS-F59071]|nr:hypothetical protein BC937DRAFT_89409 [Endogone sp. FLAS-F59071]|eukprot:RUS17852.1 hypothetical protein BC937DRAFT_89409 [Endogone sp. FLAS-F59071]
MHALQNPGSLVSCHCVALCGSGLELLFACQLAKRNPKEAAWFVDFGSWNGSAHVGNYINSFVQLDKKDHNAIYEKFPGRFWPVVTCLEEILSGRTVQDAINHTWDLITKDEPKSLYRQLQQLTDNTRDRSTFYREIDIPVLFRRIALEYYYGGISHIIQCTDQAIIDTIDYRMISYSRFWQDPDSLVKSIKYTGRDNHDKLKSARQQQNVRFSALLSVYIRTHPLLLPVIRLQSSFRNPSKALFKA